MAQLRREYERFTSRDVAVLVVAPDKRQVLRSYWEEHHLPFTALPDPQHSVLKLYGQEVNLFKLGRMPAQAIIDRDGVVRYVHYGNSMVDIPSNDELLALIDSLDVIAAEDLVPEMVR